MHSITIRRLARPRRTYHQLCKRHVEVRRDKQCNKECCDERRKVAAICGGSRVKLAEGGRGSPENRFFRFPTCFWLSCCGASQLAGDSVHKRQTTPFFPFLPFTFNSTIMSGGKSLSVFSVAVRKNTTLTSECKKVTSLSWRRIPAMPFPRSSSRPMIRTVYWFRRGTKVSIYTISMADPVGNSSINLNTGPRS